MSGKDPIVHQAGVDYGQAMEIAKYYWRNQTVDDAVIQAATATVLIHLKELRKNGPAVASPAPQAGQTRAVGTARPAPTSAVPKCPKCGGDVWDNRVGKKFPKSPDFKCKDKNCLDAAGRVTGFWEPKGPQANTNYAEQNRNVQSFERVPPSLEDDDEGDEMPF